MINLQYLEINLMKNKIRNNMDLFDILIKLTNLQQTFINFNNNNIKDNTAIKVIR